MKVEYSYTLHSEKGIEVQGKVSEERLFFFIWALGRWINQRPHMILTFFFTQASLSVQDFTFSVFGSSCNFFFLVLYVFSTLFFLYLFLSLLSCLGDAVHTVERDGKEASVRPKLRELHELLYTEIRVGHSVLFRSVRYVLSRSKKRTFRSFPVFSRVFGDL